MKEGISEALLKRYLDNACSPEEASIVENWYQSFGDAWSAEEIEAFKKNEDLRVRMLRNIKSKAGLFPQEEEQPLMETETVQLSTRKLYRPWFSMAAVLVFLFVALLLFKTEVMDLFGWNNDSITIRNANKTVLKQVLPDESIVWLSPGASVSYPAKLAGASRELEMTGEIFFEVTKDEKRPFIIHSGELTTKVLGTSFRIKMDDNQGEEVSVVTGMVAVSRKKHLLEKALSREDRSKEQPVLLVADQKVSLDNEQKKLIKTKEQENSSVKMWKRKSVSFEDASLKSIVDTLNRTFKVKIGFKDQRLNNYTLTADFSELNLISIMEIMSRSLNIQYEVAGDRIWLVKN